MGTLITHMAVSKSILKNAPKFFTTRIAILVELFQNAYRAGAKSILIAHKDGFLTVIDDGKGTHYSPIITAGESGWGPDGVAVDPAGLGAFSLLRESYVNSVVYRSQDWQMLLTPNSVNESIEVLTDLDPIVGTSVMLNLVDGISFSNQEIQNARAFYPMNFILNDEILLPPDKGVRLIDELQTSVGTVEFWTTSEYKLELKAIWQYGIVSGGTLRDKIQDALTKLPFGTAISRAIWDRGFLRAYWDVDMTSNVSAGLPNRDVLSDDSALDTAAQTIAMSMSTLVEKFVTPTLLPDLNRLETGELRKIISGIVDVDPLVKYIVDEQEPAILSYLGYTMVNSSVPEDDRWYFDSDDSLTYDTENSDAFYFKKSSLINLADENMIDCLNIHGIAAAYGMADRPAIFEIEGLTYTDGPVAFVSKLMVNGHSVKYLARSGADWGIPELDALEVPYMDYRHEPRRVALVLAMTPQDWLRMLGDHLTYSRFRGFFMRFQLEQCEAYSYAENLGEVVMRDDVIRKELTSLALTMITPWAGFIASSQADAERLIHVISQHKYDLDFRRSPGILGLIGKLLWWQLNAVEKFACWYKKLIGHWLDRIVGQASLFHTVPIRIVSENEEVPNENRPAE